MPVSVILSKSTLALPVLRDEIELLIPVIDVLISPIAVVCPLTVVCNELILDALAPIAVVCPLTVVCNVLILDAFSSIAVVCPLTVVCNELTSFTKPELALPTVACNVLTSFTKPEESFPTVCCKSEILPALTPISLVLSATFATNESSPPFTVAFNESTVASNALIEVVCPLTVDFSVVISLVLVATLVFKLPTVMEESAAPSLTSSVILPELIEVTLTA